jgi:NagD protein
MGTDILGGVQMGYRTVLVRSGGTSREDLKNYAYVPDKVVESIGALDHERLVEEFGGDNGSDSETRTVAAA